MSEKALYPSSSLTQTPTTSVAAKCVSDPDLEAKVRKTVERISENVHICANEPSLAFYRLAEHVRKALPPTVESQRQVVKLQQHLHGAYLDAEYGLETVQGMEKASSRLSNVQELLKNAIFLQQQIKYEQSRSWALSPSSSGPVVGRKTPVRRGSTSRQLQGFS